MTLYYIDLCRRARVIFASGIPPKSKSKGVSALRSLILLVRGFICVAQCTLELNRSVRDILLSLSEFQLQLEFIYPNPFGFTRNRLSQY